MDSERRASRNEPRKSARRQHRDDVILLVPEFRRTLRASPPDYVLSWHGRHMGDAERLAGGWDCFKPRRETFERGEGGKEGAHR
jgi:hypothetical protein